jgi:tetratricopeptide (TPR) repeat protein
MSTLSDRQPASVTNFLLGEREYRRMQFPAALAHYNAAVLTDSAYALAALRGAQSAGWLSNSDDDSALVEIALTHERSLPLLQQMIARGLRAYVIGDADSAVHYLERALALEPASSQTWTMLGEVYARMLPSRGPADSLSEDAFQRARSLDPDFAPALVHLERLALRRGDLTTIRRLAAELKVANADTSHAFASALMTRCLERGPASVDWRSAVRRDTESVLTVGKLFSSGAMQPSCARAAVKALLEGDSVSINYRWSSLLILAGIDEAIGPSATDGKIPRRGTAGLPLWAVSALRQQRSPGLDRDGRRTLDSLASSYDTLQTRWLWYLSLIALRLRDTAALASIQPLTARRAVSSGARAEKLMADQTSAFLKLLRGDSAAAIRDLRALKPTGRRNDIEWSPWESLATVRMLLAELLLARGDARGAIAVATLIDAPEPVLNLYYLRPSLQLRERAAEFLRDAHLAKSYRARLTQLDASAVHVVDGRITPKSTEEERR